MTREIGDLINENNNLIHSMTHYFTSCSDKEDLYQVGCIGLIKAHKNYQECLGTKFSTYAYPYILGEMKSYVRENKGIKISRDINKLALKIDKAIILLSQKLMREPTTTEISRYLEVPESLVVQASNLSNLLVSIDEPVQKTDSNVMSFHDVIADKENNIDDLLDLKNRINSLGNLDKKIVVLRYFKDLTQNETAKVLKMNQVQVSRYEKSILGRLKY